MKFKTAEINGAVYVEMQDGKALMLADDGKEISMDAGTITRLSAEAMGHRKRAEAAESKVAEAETKLKTFEGIEDPEAAVAALQTVANLDQGQLVTAGKVEEIRAAARKAAEEAVAAAAKASARTIGEITAARDALQTQLHDALIGGAFKGSKFIADKVAVPADMIEATFGRAFKIVDGKVVAHDATGAPIYNVSGEPAGFDEALEKLVEVYPHRDSILKGTTGSGGGAGQGGGGAQGGKTIKRDAFFALPPTEQGAKMKDGFTLVD